MSFNAPRAVGLLERALTAPDPTVALQALTALRQELDALERQKVARALGDGMAFSAVAQPLGITRQAAHRRYRDLTRTQTLPADTRAVLVRAREEAARQGSYCIDSRHLVLALARSGALELDVDAARRSLTPPAVRGEMPRGLHPDLHARLVCAAGPLRIEHLRQAALSDPDAGALVDRFGVPEPDVAAAG